MQLRAELAPISESYLRRLLRDSGAALSPLVEGVRQDDLTQLERTLLALEDEYAHGDRERATCCRKLVIEAREHARFALRRMAEDDPRRTTRAEMIEWMRQWLEYPKLFPQWVELRKRKLERE